MDIRPTDCLTEADHQFCQWQQEICQDAVKLILSWFDGRTFEEEAPHELVEGCHQAVWREKDHQANFEQKKNQVNIFSGDCDYGYYSGREQWHIQTDGFPRYGGIYMM